MIRVSEKDLENVVKLFDKRDVMLNVVGGLIIDVKVDKVNCKYNRKNGIIKVEGKDTKIGIDTSAVYKIVKNEDNTLLSFYLDSDIEVVISIN